MTRGAATGAHATSPLSARTRHCIPSPRNRSFASGHASPPLCSALPVTAASPGALPVCPPCLHACPVPVPPFAASSHTFNFRAERGLLFMCMCDEAFGRVRPFSFLKDVIDTFFLMFNGDETSLEGSTARSFRSVLTQKIKNYSESGAASSSVANALLSAEAAEADAKLSKMAHVKSELNTLAHSAKQNIDKVISRGEAIETLMDRTGNLMAHSDSFAKVSTKLNRRLCWEDIKLKAMMAGCIAILLYLMLSVYCGLDMRKCL